MFRDRCILSALSALLLAVLLFGGPTPASAAPFDGQAARILQEAAPIFTLPLRQRALTPEQTDSYLTLLTDPDTKEAPQLAMVLCLLLAYADDGKSLRVLQEAAQQQHPRDTMLAGAAAYALAVRQVRLKSEEAVRGYLLFRLGKSTNPIEALLLANRIFVDCPAGSAQAFFDVAKSTDDFTLRCELLSYLSQADDRDVLQQVVQEPWDTRFYVMEGRNYLLTKITPNRPFSSHDTRADRIVKVIREKLDKAKEG